MSKALEEITKEAIQLSRQQRLALARFLLELDERGPQPGSPAGVFDYSEDLEVESAWEQEILARIQAVDDGTAIGISYEDVMREVQKCLAP
jgi:hypothetical protein